MNESKKSEVQDYYGKQLTGSKDLQTNACCTDVTYTTEIKKALSQIHDEVMMKYYGCGLCVPTELEGLKVLDLGSGAGRDCYLLSNLVGEQGYVVGVDMTPEQLEVANKHIDWHTKKYGYKNANVEFKEGNIEKLNELDLKDGFFDLIISNCVVNLADDKEAVLSEAHRVLKEGGEFYFSDVYCNRRIPKHLVDDPVLYGECLSGALYWNDFENLAKKVGFNDPRIVESRVLTIENPALEKRLEGYEFYSVTYRLFKLPELEAACEDYGHAVIYKGSEATSPNTFKLDDHHVFATGKTEKVCGNSYMMLNDTRFKKHFEFIGNFERHFGIFEGCGTDIPFSKKAVTDTTIGTEQSASCC